VTLQKGSGVVGFPIPSPPRPAISETGVTRSTFALRVEDRPRRSVTATRPATREAALRRISAAVAPGKQIVQRWCVYLLSTVLWTLAQPGGVRLCVCKQPKLKNRSW
jgi:hypothetical protein